MVHWLRRRFTLALVLFLGLGMDGFGLAAEAGKPGVPPSMNAPPVAPEKAGSELHELPLNAVDLGHLGPLPITNSMVVTWIVALGLIVWSQRATRKMQAVPSGSQNFWEWLVESLYDLLEGILGRRLTLRTFWFFATIFIFILSCYWFGLIPGVGTVGWGVYGEHGFEVTKPVLRGGNTDLNMTFAMAMIFFACWTVWALQINGVKGFFLHLFGPKGDMTGFLRLLMIVVFFFVGLLEVVSIMFRPVSLSFRLFGNSYAGENMLEAMSRLIPSLSWLIPIPFYLLELLVGLAQALVFMLLTAVFTLLICEHEEASEAGHH